MKKLLFTLLCLLVFAGSFGQKWTSAYRFPKSLQPVALEAPAANVVIIATDNGIHYSSDTGATFNTVMSVSELREMKCIGNNCYAISKYQLLKSTNKGASWTAVSAPVINGSNQLMTMRVWSEDKVLLWIGYPSLKDSVFYTLDGGTSWINGKTAHKGAPILIHTENTVFDLSSSGSIAQISQDKGKTWSNTNMGTYRTDFKIWNFLDSMRGFVSSIGDISGDGSTYEVRLRKTLDGGKTWSNMYQQYASNPPFPQIYLSHCISEKTGWLSTSYNGNNMFLKTTDSGKTWNYDTMGWSALGNPFPHILHMKMYSETFGWALRKPIPGDTVLVLLKYGKPEFNPSTIKGRVYIDINNNCLYDAGTDIPVKNKVIFTQGSYYYDFTDQNGEYEITGLGQQTHSVDAGLVIDGIKIVSFLCSIPGVKQVNITAGNSVITGIDFPVHATLSGIPSVSAQGLKRACERNTTLITYENLGLSEVKNAKVIVKKPEHVDYLSADKSFTVDANGNYVFDVGDLPSDFKGTIRITDSVHCLQNNILGRVACTEVYIYGDSVNYKSDTAAWDESEVIVKARCLNGWINFQVINTTANAMGDSAELRFFSNATLKDKKKYKLGANDTLNFTIHADFTTWRVEADQRPGHPLSQYAQATIEGCEGEGAGTVSTGFVNKLPVNDFKFKKHVHCETIRGSYDPNDKTVYPEGLTANNYLKPGTPLTYRIRFQNTGNDTAFKVVVKDTLSPHIDLASFRFLGASHPHTYKITGQGQPVLEVTFNNINLPDSTTDNPGSNGFFYYTANHKAAIPQGTKIDNTAHIYFDFNSAIVTNTASVTIKDTSLISIDPVTPVTEFPFILKDYTKDTLCVGDTFTLAIIGEGPYNWFEISNPSVSLGTGFEFQKIAQASAIYIGQTTDGFDTLEVLVKSCAIGPDAVNEVSNSIIGVYPNPSANGIFSTEIPANPEGYTFKVIDLTGRMAGTVKDGTIDLAQAKPGIYILVITTADNAVLYKKLVKE